MILLKYKNEILKKMILLVISLTIILGNSATIDISAGLIHKGIPIKLTDIIAIAIIFYFILCKRFKIIKIESLKLLILWVITGIFSIFINAYRYNYTISEIMYGVLYPIRMMLYIIIYFIMINYLHIRKYSFNKLCDLYIKSYLIVCVIGIIQMLLFPNAFDFYNILKSIGVYILNPDPHSGRMFSLYLDPNFLASILCMGILLSLAKILSEKLIIKNILFFIIIVLSILATSSRSGIVGILIGFITFIVLSVDYKKQKIDKRIPVIFILTLIVMFILIVFVGDKIRVFDRIINFESDPSAQGRFNDWENSIELIKDNILFGVGYNMIGFVRGNTSKITAFGADSSILLVTMTTGIIGLIIYLRYIVKLIIDVLKLRNCNNFYYANSIVSILISSVVMSSFNNLLFYTLWFIPFIVLSNYYILQYKIKEFE